MIEKTVQQLANMIQVHNDISSFQDQTVQGVSINSKSIQQENLFIPLKGEKHDGHEFVEQAMRQGAVHLYGRKTSRILRPISLFSSLTTR